MNNEQLQIIVRALEKTGSGFNCALADTLIRADSKNLDKLCLAFSDTFKELLNK